MFYEIWYIWHYRVILSLFTGCSAQVAHLQIWVAEYHKLGTGIDVIPFDEGEVRPTNSLQTWKVWAPLPVLCVVLQHLLPQTCLLTASGNKYININTNKYKHTRWQLLHEKIWGRHVKSIADKRAVNSNKSESLTVAWWTQVVRLLLWFVELLLI